MPRVYQQKHADFKVSHSETPDSMIPTMGICYMLQYMDKLALSQTTLMGIRADLVSGTRASFRLQHTNLFSHYTAPGWQAIYLVLCHLLFWLSRMEWTYFVSDCSPSPRQISSYLCVCQANHQPLFPR
jgi:hypothetical protein